MLNENIPFNSHKRKTRKELIKLELQLQKETNENKKDEIQRQIALCESLKWKDYKLYTMK